MKTAKDKTALLKTSSINDVKRSAGKVAITGLQEVFEKDIISIRQFKDKAEVSKVETIGASYTPTGSTTYIVEISLPGTRYHGITNSIPKRYPYVTPAAITDLGATAALQREAINVALVAKINADSSNYVAAATLGTGTGFTITDDAGYFPAKSAAGQSHRGGASVVKLAKDINGLGFVDSTDRTVSTAAVYSFGIGSRMDDDIPVVYALGGGNIVQGEVNAPVAADGTYATSGQKYHAFLIESSQASKIPTISDIKGSEIKSQMVFVDNGKGTTTTNATATSAPNSGFTAFAREMHKLMISSLYAADSKTVQEFFDKPIAFQGPLGAAPAGTANALGWMVSPYGSLHHINIGTQTIVAPVLNATGLLIDQDDTATEGAHYSASTQTIAANKFIVGQGEFSVMANITMADWTDAAFKVGFRKIQAYDATFNNYTDIAAIGNGSSAAGTTWINGDLIATNAGLNGAAHVQAISAVAPVDAAYVSFRLHVDINGAVTAYADGVSYPIYSAGTTQMVFDAGDAIIPFFQTVNIGSGDPAVSINTFVSLPSSSWIVD